MRQGPLFLLLFLNLATSLAQAEETITAPTERQTELESRLSDNQRQRETLKQLPDVAASPAGQAQLAGLRQENQRLRMQLQQEQLKQQAQPQLLSDQQQWFAVGGGVGVLGFLLGVLTTRGRRRRQWLN